MVIHESSGMSFEFINAGERVTIRIGKRLYLSGLIDAFGLEHLLVVAGVSTGLLFHALLLLPAQVLLMMSER
jgi:hypothetical protein